MTYLVFAILQVQWHIAPPPPQIISHNPFEDGLNHGHMCFSIVQWDVPHNVEQVGSDEKANLFLVSGVSSDPTQGGKA